MATEEAVSALKREGKFNKNAARRVRAAGRLPGVVYGGGEESVAVELDPKQMLRILHSETGHNTIFNLQMDGAQSKAMIVDWQFEPVKDRLIHVDLKRIAMNKAMLAEVPVVLTGTAFGVKNEDGVLDQLLREVEIECLPSDIPPSIEVDVTEMKVGDMIRVSDLPHGGKFRFITEEDTPVAHVIVVKEDQAVLDADAAAAALTPAEPEVTKKGKADTDEGAGEK